MFECKKCGTKFKKEAIFNNHSAKNNCKNKTGDKTGDTTGDTTGDNTNTTNIMSFCVSNDIKEISIIDKGKSTDPKTAGPIQHNSNSDIVRENEINNKLTRLENKIDKLIDLMSTKLTKKSNNDTNTVKSMGVKKEKLQVDDNIALEYLEKMSYEADAEFLFNYYLKNIEKKDYLIKKLKNNDITFWGNDEWIVDKNGVELKNIFSHNLKKIYTRVNRYDSIQNHDLLLKQQEHINTINDKKNQSLLFDYFIQKYL